MGPTTPTRVTGILDVAGRTLTPVTAMPLIDPQSSATHRTRTNPETVTSPTIEGEESVRKRGDTAKEPSVSEPHRVPLEIDPALSKKEFERISRERKRHAWKPCGPRLPYAQARVNYPVLRGELSRRHTTSVNVGSPFKSRTRPSDILPDRLKRSPTILRADISEPLHSELLSQKVKRLNKTLAQD